MGKKAMWKELEELEQLWNKWKYEGNLDIKQIERIIKIYHFLETLSKSFIEEKNLSLINNKFRRNLHVKFHENFWLYQRLLVDIEYWIDELKFEKEEREKSDCYSFWIEQY